MINKDKQVTLNEVEVGSIYLNQFGPEIIIFRCDRICVTEYKDKILVLGNVIYSTTTAFSLGRKAISITIDERLEKIEHG